MIDIKFEYGIDSEVQRVRNTLNDLEWLNKNKYRYSLPVFKNEPKKANEEGIRNAVEKEYSATEFKSAEEVVCSAWKDKWTKIEEIQNSIIGAEKLDQIKITFTKYGTGGSYWLPNKIIINLKDKILEDLIKTVMHESIHLMIEKLISDNKVDHWRKERIVNLIIDKEFQSAYKMNGSPEYAKDVDVIFKEYYPNMILITKESGKLKTPDIIS